MWYLITGVPSTDMAHVHMWMDGHFWNQVNIWNFNCARATAIIFDTWTGVLVKLSKKMTGGGLEPPTFRFMPNALTYWAIRARHLLLHVFEYWLWRCRYFWSKVNIWNVNCARATASIFNTRTGVKIFETENVATWGGFEPPTFGFMPKIDG